MITSEEVSYSINQLGNHVLLILFQTLELIYADSFQNVFDCGIVHTEKNSNRYSRKSRICLCLHFFLFSVLFKLKRVTYIH